VLLKNGPSRIGKIKGPRAILTTEPSLKPFGDLLNMLDVTLRRAPTQLTRVSLPSATMPSRAIVPWPGPRGPLLKRKQPGGRKSTLMTVAALRTALRRSPTAMAAAAADLPPTPALPKNLRANLRRRHSRKNGGGAVHARNLLLCFRNLSTSRFIIVT